VSGSVVLKSSICRYCGLGGFPYIVIRITQQNLKHHARAAFLFLTRDSNPAATLQLKAVLSQHRFYTALETSNTAVRMFVYNNGQNGECCDQSTGV
jgi:hypothetical protein